MIGHIGLHHSHPRERERSREVNSSLTIPSLTVATLLSFLNICVFLFSRERERERERVCMWCFLKALITALTGKTTVIVMHHIERERERMTEKGRKWRGSLLYTLYYLYRKLCTSKRERERETERERGLYPYLNIML